MQKCRSLLKNGFRKLQTWMKRSDYRENSVQVYKAASQGTDLTGELLKQPEKRAFTHLFLQETHFNASSTPGTCIDTQGTAGKSSSGDGGSLRTTLTGFTMLLLIKQVTATGYQPHLTCIANFSCRQFPREKFVHEQYTAPYTSNSKRAGLDHLPMGKEKKPN